MSLHRLFILFFLPFLCIAADQTSTDHACTDDSECLNGGVCVQGNAAVNGIHYSRCTCTHPWGGKNCEHKCSLDCQNSGVCELSLQTDPNASPYSCRCRGKFTGDLCQTPYVACPDRSWCLNGGTCILGDVATNTYACECPRDEEGYSCDRIANVASGVVGALEKDTGLSVGGIVGVVAASTIIVFGTFMTLIFLNKRRGYKISEANMRKQTDAAFELDDMSVGSEREQII